MNLNKNIVFDWNLRMELLKSGVGDSLISNGKLTKTPQKVLKVKRSSFISSALIDMEVEVHNGKNNIILKINKDMVGYRFGEFVNTSVWGGAAVLAKSSKQNKQNSKKTSSNKGKVKGK